MPRTYQRGEGPSRAQPLTPLIHPSTSLTCSSPARSTTKIFPRGDVGSSDALAAAAFSLSLSPRRHQDGVFYFGAGAGGVAGSPALGDQDPNAPLTRRDASAASKSPTNPITAASGRCHLARCLRELRKDWK